MPKPKGSTGGRLIKLSPSEYEKILKFLQGQYNPNGDSQLTPKERFTLKEKAKKFVALSDQKEGAWPHGFQLYIKTCGDKDNPLLPAMTKLFVPEDKVKQVIGTNVTLNYELTTSRTLSHYSWTFWKKQNSPHDFQNSLWNYRGHGHGVH